MKYVNLHKPLFLIFCCLSLFCQKGLAQIEEKKGDCTDSICDTETDRGVTVEIANLNLSLSVKGFFSSKNKTLLQVPLFLELKVPVITEEGNIKWLLQGGGGWMGFVNTEEICDDFFRPEPPSKPEAPFDDGFFTQVYKDRLEEYKDELVKYNAGECFGKKKQTFVDSFPYFLTRTGLQYGFDSMSTFLVGGPVFIVNGPSTIGWMGELGVDIPHGIFHTKLAVEALYYERFYWGISISLGFSLNTWKEYISEI